MKLSIFCDITHCSPLEGNRRFGGIWRLHPALLATCFELVSLLAYSSTTKIKATCFSETSVDFERITWRYIPEDRSFKYIYWSLYFNILLHWSITCNLPSIMQQYQYRFTWHQSTFNSLKYSLKCLKDHKAIKTFCFHALYFGHKGQHKSTQDTHDQESSTHNWAENSRDTKDRKNRHPITSKLITITTYFKSTTDKVHSAVVP
jgi:hypothetical protein